MKLRNILASVTFFTLIIFACSPDDSDFTPAEEIDRVEQQVVDEALLQTYLSTHYYNSDNFIQGENYQVNDIVIAKLEDGQTVPSGHTLLSTVVEAFSTNFEGVEYVYYVLKINQGGGSTSPSFTDKVRVSYEGSLADDGSVFDNRIIQDFDLVGLNEFQGVIPGWQRVFPNFNSAESFSISANGEVLYDNYGLGVMFLPSGLGYFGRALEGIPIYSNLVFKFALFQTEVNDHDNDGVPSILEDLNNDSSTFDEDTDEDIISNYVDPDDDGDGILTINEVLVKTYTEDEAGNPFMSYADAQSYFDSNAVQFENFVSIIRQIDNTYVLNTVILPNTNSSDVPDLPDYLDSTVTNNLSDD
ncbi:MAG: hypothetical protein HKP48_06460 [Winogradskyella sp.]|uniref:FKBP-type peptidyl-prolyl cis-trans isomerase n=1 Tax=Winogradskyella sp. TaxID=1883156 RepID=UPI0017B378B4|nr:FKBP-type peptidyl-prolyl cis-trans isomerase [Winogradskyella sp.]MBT8244477.1 hypothetical protein [Winogradskyella sp.]NNK22933.1 hypothetical protein [Winogradskyella sp.]